MKTRRHILQAALRSVQVVALLLLPSCVKLEAERQVDGPAAVSFDAYLNRDVSTRSGAVGVLDGERLKDTGFGVFAFHTGASHFGPSAAPEFMYNTQVTRPGTAWEYTPVKYWPNQDTEDAVDRVSFFAYAPFVDADPATGEPSLADDGTPDRSRATGIVRLSRSSDKGEPSLGYVASFDPRLSVDLCWGAPLLDRTRPGTSEKMLFTFRHALAALNVQVDAVTDETGSPGSNPLHSDTRIYVRSVSFSGVSEKGTLSLSGSDAPSWSGFIPGTALNRSALTVHDGRLDGLEALYDDSGEMPCGLNPGIVQQSGYNAKPGVTEEIVNLFSSDQVGEPMFVIPNGYPLALDIVYDVETRDDKLADSFLSDGQTHGRSTRVNIRTSITTSAGPIRLEAGKRYVLRLHLGMTSVKFQAEIAVTDHWAEWTEGKESAVFSSVIILGQYTDGSYDFSDGSGLEWD